MKRMIGFFISLLFIGNLNSYAQVKSVSQIEKETLLKMVKTSFVYRLEIMLNQKLLDNLYESKAPLTGFDINTINDEAKERFQFGQKAHRYLNHYKRDLKSIKTRRYDDETEEVKNTLIAFALATVMSDNYLFTYSQFNKNKKMRRLLNEADPAIKKEKNLFKKSVKQFYSLKNRKQFRKAKKIFNEIYLKNKKQFLKYPVLKIAEELIVDSFTYQKLIPLKGFSRTKNFFKLIGQNVGLTFKVISDSIAKATSGVVYGGSKLFGNTAGLFQSRRGKLYQDQDFINHAQKNLEPLDVILEKTPFRLTDKFIPGYWGHAGIYIGTKQDLIDLGIYNHPTVVAHHEAINQGATIIEALRSDVEFNSVNHFSDIDDFAILRLRNPVSRKVKKEYILRAFAQVGKKYDFSFNVETSKTIVCSELHYRVFEHIPFNTTKIFGRYTIDVDQIAEQALINQPFEPIMLYIDGQEIHSSQTQARYDQLIDREPRETVVPFLKNKKELSDVFNLSIESAI